MSNLEIDLARLKERVATLERDLDAADRASRDAKDHIVRVERLSQTINMRAMFLAEIVREAGLIAKVDLEAITARVRAEYETDDRLHLSAKSAAKAIDDIFRELNGDYSDAPDDL